MHTPSSYSILRDANLLNPEGERLDNSCLWLEGVNWLQLLGPDIEIPNGARMVPFGWSPYGDCSMAGFIARDENREWSSANWVYWGFMDHVLDALKDSPEVAHRAEGSKWMQMLSFDILAEEDAAAAEKILDACSTVARKCSDGELLCKVEERVLDADSQKQFREAMQELLPLLVD